MLKTGHFNSRTFYLLAFAYILYISKSIKAAHHANVGFHPRTQNLELCVPNSLD